MAAVRVNLGQVRLLCLVPLLLRRAWQWKMEQKEKESPTIRLGPNGLESAGGCETRATNVATYSEATKQLRARRFFLGLIKGTKIRNVHSQRQLSSLLLSIWTYRERTSFSVNLTTYHKVSSVLVCLSTVLSAFHGISQLEVSSQ